MILRLSTKLARKVHVPPPEALPLDDNPYGDWSANVFNVGRRQYILVTNTVSLYSAIMRGAGITTGAELVGKTVELLEEALARDGFRLLFERLVVPSPTEVVLSKALNRSVTGSMNDFVQQARLFLTDRQLSPHDASAQLNRTPMGALDFAFPIEVFSQTTPTDR